jgi:hypothetical protein
MPTRTPALYPEEDLYPAEDLYPSDGTPGSRTRRERFVDRAIELEAAYLLAPETAADPLTNLGTVPLSPGELKNGAVLSASGLVDGGAAAVLDGTNDYIDTLWKTRTNLCTNPGFEVNTAGWDGSSSTYINTTAISRVTTSPHSGSGCLKVEATEPVPGGARFTFAGAATTDYTIAFWIKGASAGATVQCYLGEADAGTFTLKAVVLTTEWQKVEISFKSAADANLIFVTRSTAKNTTWFLDDVLIEKGTSVGEFFPTAAQLESGEAGWSGTAHASASDIGPFARGTARTFVGFANRTDSASNDVIFGSTSTALFRLASGTNTPLLFPKASNFKAWESAWPGNAQDVAFGVIADASAKTAQLYIDGTDKGSGSTTDTWESAGSTMTLGGWFTGGASDPFKGSLLPFAVFTRALSAAEIKSLYRATTYEPLAVTREYPPDTHCVIVRAADGTPVARWAEDEGRAANVMSDLKLSGVVPGGRKELRATLPRNPRQDWPDLDGFLEIECQQPGRNRIWHGRIGKAPRSDGDRMVIGGEAVGWAAALEDRKALRLGFIDRALERLGEIPAQLRADLTKVGADLSAISASIDPFGSGPEANKPAGLSFTHSALKAGKNEWGEISYDSGGVDLAEVLFDFEGRTEAPDADFFNRVDLSRDGVTSHVEGTDLNATSALQQAVSTTAEGMRYARFMSAYVGSAEIDPYTELFRFANIVALAAHGLAPQGTWPDLYLTAAQILRYAVPLYSSLNATDDSVEDDEYPITQAWYPDRGTLGRVVDDVLKYGLMDWFVKDAKLFEVRRPGSYGRRWQAYQGPSNLEEAGIDAERAWDRIVVAYQDTAGATRTVGYPGSGADVESATLQITDPDHPAVRAEVVREDLLTIDSISTANRAMRAGEEWLREANELSRSGKAELSGHIQDADGVYRPVGQVGEGDYIRFPDARDTSYRKIVDYDYDASSRKVVVTLDAPSESVKALLERYRAALTPLGL